MDITDVRVRKVVTNSRMKAIATITFDDCFVVRDIKVIDGQDGLFVAMPSRKSPDGQFRDVAHPIKQEFRDIIESRIIEIYNQIVDEVPVEQTEA
ncbi:MAG TPA: septation regulator SpoVG [Bacillota bacterium]|nr:MAG: putative septation protein SpoVG [Firmicutes bacterium ADurb.Bin153]HNV33961.1 septation regulator SpoVG [Bacillota bacterium]HPU95419.1 septation regulator SpoVG [Bacillota bacterium]